jgi:hypothetical protein
MALNGSPGIPRKVQKLELSELEQFEEVFLEIIDILSQRWSLNKEISDALDWFKEVCQIYYNTSVVNT